MLSHLEHQGTQPPCYRCGGVEADMFVSLCLPPKILQVEKAVKYRPNADMQNASFSIVRLGCVLLLCGSISCQAACAC